MNDQHIPSTELKNSLPEAKKALDFSEHITNLIPTAGTIDLTDKQREILYAPVKDDNVEIRPDGLIYLPWMEYVSRLRDAFGASWAIIPQGMPTIKNDFILWSFYLVIQGKLAGFAVGEQQYYANNSTMTYGDALEGAKSNALMRLCKGIGISLELWKPSFIRGWKEKFAERYPATYPDGKPILDKKTGKQKEYWRKKGSNGHDAEPEPETPPPKETNPEDMETFKRESEKKFSEYHDRLMLCKNIFELRAWYQKHYHEMQDGLLSEHFEMLTKLKDEQKAKFEEKK